MKKLIAPPIYQNPDRGFLAGTTLCKACNLGKKMGNVEFTMKIEGKEKESDPDPRIQMKVCPHCGNTTMRLTNVKEFEAAYSHEKI